MLKRVKHDKICQNTLGRPLTKPDYLLSADIDNYDAMCLLFIYCLTFLCNLLTHRSHVLLYHISDAGDTSRLAGAR